MADKYLVKPLPYAYDALSGISKETNTFHHDKHYAGYVAKRNEIYEKLKSSDRSKSNANYSEFGELKRRETFNANGQVLHELFWEVLGGNGKPNGELVVKKIEADFGSIDKWKEDFKASALSALGWVVTAFDFSDGEIHNYTGDTHNQGGVWGCVPLLVIDVFEHAYYRDYGPNRAAYIDAVINNIDWKKVEKYYSMIELVKKASEQK